MVVRQVIEQRRRPDILVGTDRRVNHWSIRVLFCDCQYNKANGTDTEHGAKPSLDVRFQNGQSSASGRYETSGRGPDAVTASAGQMLTGTRPAMSDCSGDVEGIARDQAYKGTSVSAVLYPHLANDPNCSHTLRQSDLRLGVSAVDPPAATNAMVRPPYRGRTTLSPE